jgi:hypothetical protein
MAGNDIRLMEAAIALAEELNFSRAAQKLHITQPALTKRIAELEDRLGISLFARDHQMVDVSDSGRAFVEEARLSVLHGERAFQAAQRAARGVDVVLIRFWSQRCCRFNCHCSRDCELTSRASSRVIWFISCSKGGSIWQLRLSLPNPR